MSLPSRHLPERSNSSQSITLLPAKAYIPPSSARATTESSNPLIHAHVGDEAMPTEDEIKDATTKSRSSSTTTASSYASSNDDEKKGVLPRADVKVLHDFSDEIVGQRPVSLIGANDASTSLQVPSCKRFPKPLIGTPRGSKRAWGMWIVVDESLDGLIDPLLIHRN
ncbi:hypothetical protein HO133_009420 [Letharia lupina]|uniref:Uncharacterized protein n=1 Tax=Letharia lupina TaxID=560253 RepID=A0A8H6CNM4_9LECA|nr:uncharacterized protein HO133_009420 [Letharia lupina]KAF6226554.1 hypothetical protein HO133_009420 [Letharia lupina]